MNKNPVYSVITGASRGLGKAFAEVCAAKGQNLVLISLSGEDLQNVAEILSNTYHIKVHHYETDLTKSENIAEVAVFLEQFPINTLINNAGVGGLNDFEDASTKDLEDILLLNMNSLVLLTHRLLPALKQHENSYILNISSLAAFSPIPLKTVYSASKAFIYFFSRGLNEELKGTGVHVAVAHPGGMATNGEVSKRIDKMGTFLKRSILTPRETAVICIDKMLKFEKIIIPGKMNRLGALLQKIVPVSVQMRIYKNRFRKQLTLGS